MFTGRKGRRGLVRKPAVRCREIRIEPTGLERHLPARTDDWMIQPHPDPDVAEQRPVRVALDVGGRLRRGRSYTEELRERRDCACPQRDRSHCDDRDHKGERGETICRGRLATNGGECCGRARNHQSAELRREPPPTTRRSRRPPLRVSTRSPPARKEGHEPHAERRSRDRTQFVNTDVRRLALHGPPTVELIHQPEELERGDHRQERVPDTQREDQRTPVRSRANQHRRGQYRRANSTSLSALTSRVPVG